MDDCPALDQNTITHYNFYYNTNNKLTDVLVTGRSPSSKKIIPSSCHFTIIPWKQRPRINEIWIPSWTKLIRLSSCTTCETAGMITSIC